jgi:PIN domain nuclease of toxin-antitoxin system
LQVVPFDEDLAEHTGALRFAAKTFWLSLGDRACSPCGAIPPPALTADRMWKDLDLHIEVQTLR